jgi:hypothetical protein
MPDYVAVYTGVLGKEEYHFWSPSDLLAGKKATEYHADHYYVEDPFLKPLESRFFPERSCARKRIVGTFDDIFLEENGKLKRVCTSLFAVPKEEKKEIGNN